MSDEHAPAAPTAFLNDLTGPDKWLRAAALKLIAAHARHELLPYVTAALSDAEPLVRVTALYALGHLGAAAALPSLRGLLLDEAVSWLTYGERVCDVAEAVIAQLAALPAPTALSELDDPAEMADSIVSIGAVSIGAVSVAAATPLQTPIAPPTTTDAAPAQHAEDDLTGDAPDWLQAAGVPTRADIPDWLMDTITLAQTPGVPIPPPIDLTPTPPPLVTTPGVRFNRFTAPPPAQTALSTALFSAFFPQQILPAQRHSLIVYTYSADLLAEVERDVERFRKSFDGPPPTSAAHQPARLSVDTPVTIVPECDALTFDPPTLTKRWAGDWTRFPFLFQSQGALPPAALEVRVSVRVYGVELAHIVCVMQPASKRATATDDIGLRFPVASRSSAGETPPLAVERYISRSAPVYERVFISYSRDDHEVAEAYRLAQLAAGHAIFTDTYAIRSGENWRAALARAIDQADVFQLFWSASAAESPHVRDEWRYALQFRCPETLCEGFIRPVYWHTPLLEPPRELRHLDFRPVEFVPPTSD